MNGGPPWNRSGRVVAVRMSSTGNWAALSSGVVGAAGFVLSWIPLLGIVLGDLLAILALILGLVGLVKPGGKGLAVVGMVLAVVTLALKSLPVVRWL